MEDLFSPEFWESFKSRKGTGQRQGQALFNTAEEFYPTETHKITGTIYDPFYNDGNIVLFFERLVELLTAPPRKKH